jgi:hypothetical protein
MSEALHRNTEGWSEPGGHGPRRNENPPERFVEETEPGDPACAAWDEPGYVDPDLSHAGLPLGARYWQGFAKACTPARPAERALSPGWVARVTRPAARSTPSPAEESDPLRPRVVREKERDRSSWRHFFFWPG